MRRILPTSKLLVLLTMACALFIAVGCGGAADTQAEPQTQEKSSDAGKMAEPAKAKEEAAPVAAATSAESMSGLPGAGEKVTVLVVDVQNKIMFSRLTDGPDLKYLRMIQDDLFAGGGGDEVKAGLITEWEMSPDSKTWTLTHGDDIKWHNGDTLDADDIHHSFSLTIGPEALRQLDLGCLEAAKHRVGQAHQERGDGSRPQPGHLRVKRAGPRNLRSSAPRTARVPERS